VQTCVGSETANRKEKKKRKEEPSSLFQRQRVDMLLTELAQKFPPKSFPATHQVQPVTASTGPAEKTGIAYCFYLFFYSPYMIFYCPLLSYCSYMHYCCPALSVDFRFLSVARFNNFFVANYINVPCYNFSKMQFCVRFL